MLKRMHIKQLMKDRLQTQLKLQRKTSEEKLFLMKKMGHPQISESRFRKIRKNQLRRKKS